MKQIRSVHTAPLSHWVGDGFPVRSLFSYANRAQELSPFLLLDYAGPAQFTPSVRARGVGTHPHRGFETVSIVYQGELEHRDSLGNGGRIGPGDVQWMTAASGILHEEFHSQAFTRAGGTLEMVQLWVNLPSKDKLAAPGYQTLLARDIPSIELPRAAGSVRIIAGEFEGAQGPARTHTPMHVWDLRLQPHAALRFSLPAGWTTLLIVLRDSVTVNGSGKLDAVRTVLLDRAGTDVELASTTGATVLVLSGEPIDEPVIGYGPFVMNTQTEIVQAIQDFNEGRFGRMVA